MTSDATISHKPSTSRFPIKPTGARVLILYAIDNPSIVSHTFKSKFVRPDIESFRHRGGRHEEGYGIRTGLVFCLPPGQLTSIYVYTRDYSWFFNQAIWMGLLLLN